MTTDGELLLRTVRENPDDDTPRLVYADWLQEQGEDDLAEFIRVQIEREQPGRRYRWETERRESALFRAVARSLSRDFGAYVVTREDEPTGNASFVVRLSRGLVESVRCTAKEWLSCAERLLARHPVRTVTLTTHVPVESKDGRGYGDESWRLPGRRWRTTGELVAWFFRRYPPDETRPATARRAGLALLPLEWPGVEFVLPS